LLLLCVCCVMKTYHLPPIFWLEIYYFDLHFTDLCISKYSLMCEWIYLLFADIWVLQQPQNNNKKVQNRKSEMRINNSSKPFRNEYVFPERIVS
jgi:hypothetical protein